MSEQPKCPVDHSAREAWVQKSQNTPVSEAQAKCPVDHTSRSEWVQKVSVSASPAVEAIEVSDGCTSENLGKSADSGTSSSGLSTEREISSIPRTAGNANWIYPSQKQFFEAMKRKNWSPDASDMQTVVPIHNAVNERAWQHILDWEKDNYETAVSRCGGIKLTSFKGDLKKLTPRAWFNSAILGYEKPFDRHDWVVDRCGVEVPYVIDFYGGNGKGASFYLDVRPKVNSWEGLKLRLGRALGY